MQAKKKTSPILWIALLSVGAAAYVLTTPEVAPKKTTVRKTSPKKTTVVSLITEEDLKASFERVNNPVKNAFMPFVKKSSADTTQSSPNSLPAEFTGGEAGWAYTGTAAVDGRIQAVVENQGTGQGDFLSVGQNWKKARVVAVTESTLVLEGMSGQQITVKMQEKLSSSSMLAGGFAPVNVNQGLRGQIGPVAVRPEGAPTGAVASEGDGNAN
ncbi:MAG: hypothetical protein H7Y17_13295 [Chlorobia bacterium]|nr:hypothetical protein [Fimbriimonadaceae bacterium]